VIGTYLGTRGDHLLQQFLPNTNPPGAPNACPTCPSGFSYVTSNATSSRQAGQVLVRRRLRNGLTASAQYTLARATDSAATFVATTPGSAGSTRAPDSLQGADIAQDWRNLDAERGPSAFDQRHVLAVQFQYTTGVGVRGGGLVDGVKGSLFKGWTVTSQLNLGSGLPSTPIYMVTVPGTGVIGIRPDLTGAPLDGGSGSYANPAAYAAATPGQWGTAGRHSIRGPAMRALNAGISRSFPRGDHLDLEWRLDATNVLNLVNYSTINTIVGNPQFGQPTRATPMRQLRTALRLRF
jgi:hypothetical protein